jgi:hypothetical protein
MINNLSSIIKKLTKTQRSIYLFGFFFVFLITLKEVIGMSYNNFQIFSYGSLDFWTGINPYTHWNHLSILGKPLDLFLYGPLFSILFTPFALLPGWLGVFCWNIFTYTLFYFSIFTLPDQFSFIKKNLYFFSQFYYFFAPFDRFNLIRWSRPCFFFHLHCLRRNLGFGLFYLFSYLDLLKCMVFFN